MFDYPEPYITRVKVQNSDLDGLGHANNACYVNWCERSAWRHSESLGLTLAHYHRLDRAVVIQKAGYDYYRPAFEGDELLVATWLTYCDDKLRIERRFQIVNNDTSAVVLRGHWLLAGITLSTGKATRLPREFLDIFSGAVITHH